MGEPGDVIMIPKKPTLPENSFPYPVFLWTVLSLAFMGLADSIYLAVSHYRVYMDMSYRSFCAITKSINCDTVSQSSYAVLFGMPVPVWGIFGYLFILLLLGIGRFATRSEKQLWPTIFFVSLVYSIYSVILAGISTFLIKSYCLMCILSYAINLLLVFYSWLINNRFGSYGLMMGFGKDLRFMRVIRTKVLWVLIPFLSILIVVWTIFPQYWSFQPKINPVDITSGMTSHGDPWIGSLHPSLTIVEYSDYRCFQCRKMHFYLRDLIQRNPEAIRLVHRHFPMDKDFNPLVKEQVHAGAGRMALLAIYGASQDRFWQINDILFSLEKDHKLINMKQLAQKGGLDTKDLVHKVGQPAFVKKLYADIKEGLLHGISGTPAYVIDNVVYTAQIPPDILKPYLK